MPPSNRNSLSSVNLKRGGLAILVTVAWPVALSTLLTQLMTFVDALWVGRLGPWALAAAGVAGAVFGVMIALSQLANAPTMAFVARFAGADNRLQVQGAFLHGLLIAVVMGVVLAIAGLFASGPIFDLFRQVLEAARPGVSGPTMQAATETVSQVRSAGVPYLTVLFLILPFVYVAGVSFIALQATGDTRTPLVISFISNVINVGLDPLLIFGWLGFPRLGLLGAGIATGVATLFNVICSLFMLGRKGLLGLIPIRFKVIGRFLKVGFFAMIQGITRPLTGIGMYYIVGISGVFAVAAFTAGLRVIGITFIFTAGLSVAVQSLVGQYLGAGSVVGAKRMVRLSIFSGIVMQVVLSGLLFLAARWLVGIFVPAGAEGGKEVIKMGSSYLRTLAPFLLLVPVSASWAGAQYGAGRTLGPALAAVLSNLIIKLPAAWMLSQLAGMETSGVWLAIGISVVAETVVNAGFYFRGRWERTGSHAVA